MGVKEKEEAALARSGVRAEPAGAPVCRGPSALVLNLAPGTRLPARHMSMLILMMRVACLCVICLLYAAFMHAAKACASWPACRDPNVNIGGLGTQMLNTQLSLRRRWLGPLPVVVRPAGEPGGRAAAGRGADMHDGVVAAAAAPAGRRGHEADSRGTGARQPFARD